MLLSQLFICSWLFLFANPPQSAELQTITTAQAKTHLGETVKVCGLLMEVREPFRRSGPTYLNFDAKYPKNEFSAIIWKWQRHRFVELKAQIGKQVCVTGQVKEYQGKPQITLTINYQFSTLN